MSNKFDTFEYIQEADFSRLLKQRFREENEGMERAEQAARRNDEQRIKNAQQFDRLIRQIGSFSTTAANFLESRRDENDLKLRNKNQLIIDDTELSYTDKYKWDKAYKEGQKTHNYYTEIARKEREAGNLAIAEDLENLSGRREIILKEQLLQEAAGVYKSKLQLAKENFKATFDDGRVLSYGELTNEIEHKEWLNKYNVEHGFNDTSWASQEFREKYFNPTFRKVIHAEKNEFASKQIAQLENDRNELSRKRLINAAKTGTLGETLYDLLNNQRNNFESESAARLHFADILIDLESTGQLSEHEVDSMYDYEFERNDGGKFTFDSVGWPEFSKANLQLRRLDAQIKALNTKDKENSIEANRYIIDVKSQVAARGERLTELEVKEIQKDFADTFPGLDNRGKEWQYINNLANNTQEDREDMDTVDDLEDKLAKGMPIGDSWKLITGDRNLREKWRKIAETPLGKGLDPTLAANAYEYLEALLKDELEIVAMVPDSPEFVTMLRNIKTKYAEEYRKGQFDTSELKHGNAVQIIEGIIKNNPHQFMKRPVVTTDMGYGIKLSTATKDIRANPAVVTQSIIKGTEEDYKQLEIYAKNPETEDIPPIYKRIAEQNVGFFEKGWTAWSIANAQYQSQTGKELPKPNSQVQIEQKTPLVRYLLIKYPNSKRVQQAVVHDKLEGDFSHKDVLLEGVDIP